MLQVGMEATPPADRGVSGLPRESINGREGNVFTGRCRNRRGRGCIDTVYDAKLSNFWSTRCRGFKGVYNFVHSPSLVVLPDHILDWVCPLRVYGTG